MSDLESVKAKILELFSHMGIRVEIFERVEEGRTVLNLKTSDAQILIGKQGANLEALQHIVRLLSRTDSEDRVSFALDIDDYRQQRQIYLKEMARKAANQARTSGRSVALPPMPPSERRVVHNYLSLFSDLHSESQGQDPHRRIIIRIQKKPKKSGDDFNFIENS
ncbi:MAG TPA: R3H domain-containing nucleic acid-binding protein [Patescibacteria group bacterium]|nr:R3H domain-containing nucleic acid-binding protein [Patescibacteria group bacterium]